MVFVNVDNLCLRPRNGERCQMETYLGTRHFGCTRGFHLGSLCMVFHQTVERVNRIVEFVTVFRLHTSCYMYSKCPMRSNLRQLRIKGTVVNRLLNVLSTAPIYH